MLHTIFFLKLRVVLHRSDLFLKNIRKLIRTSHLSFNVPICVNTKQSGRANIVLTSQCFQPCVLRRGLKWEGGHSLLRDLFYSSKTDSKRYTQNLLNYCRGKMLISLLFPGVGREWCRNRAVWN